MEEREVRAEMMVWEDAMMNRKEFTGRVKSVRMSAPSEQKHQFGFCLHLRRTQPGRHVINAFFGE